MGTANIKKDFHKLLFILLSSTLLCSCSVQAQASPTPDMDALATQMFVEISVKNTLEANTATQTPLPLPKPIPTAVPMWISTPLPTPQNSANYSPVPNPISGMEIVFVPAGEFLMGSDESDPKYDVWTEVPQHTVYLDAFWISKYQVTNAAFNACVSAGVCDYSVGISTNPNFVNQTYASHPVIYISWYMAQTYCQWTGGRLPTEAEWEKSARGTDGRWFPWGNENARIQFTNSNNKIGNTTPVGAFPQGQSIYGVMDMGGNVREWVADWYAPDYFSYSPDQNPQGPETGDKKVLKGASYKDPWNYCRPANRLAHEPESPGAVRGFRCVYP